MKRSQRFAQLSDPAANGNFSRNWSDKPPEMYRRSEEPPSVNLNALDGKAASIAAAYWLDRAEQAEGTKLRRAAFATACRVRQAAGMSWSQIMGQQTRTESAGAGR